MMPDVLTMFPLEFQRAEHFLEPFTTIDMVKHQMLTV